MTLFRFFAWYAARSEWAAGLLSAFSVAVVIAVISLAVVYRDLFSTGYFVVILYPIIAAAALLFGTISRIKDFFAFSPQTRLGKSKSGDAARNLQNKVLGLCAPPAARP